MLFSRKGQDEGNAHILVALFAIFLVAFILSLPPADRAALLETGDLATGPGGVAGVSGPILLEKSVGRLEFYPPEGFDHNIPSSHIFQARNAVELHKFPSFIVKRNWFVHSKEQFEFLIDDLEHTKNVILAFDAPVARGPLKVALNGEVIFEGVLSGPTLPPIALPKPLLRQENVIEFSSGSVGAAFWKTHVLNLQNARVIGDLTDLSRTSASSIFTISPTEKENLLTATLRTVPICDGDDKGLLSMFVNDQLVYQGVPECGIPLKQSVSLSTLIAGTNNVRFTTDRGDYRLEETVIDTDLKDIRSFLEYFEIKPATFESIIRGGSGVILEIDFVDNNQRKRAELNVNGHLSFIDQKEPFYTRVLNPWVEPGARNYVEIIPETPLDIVQVRVRLT